MIYVHASCSSRVVSLNFTPMSIALLSCQNHCFYDFRLSFCSNSFCFVSSPNGPSTRWPFPIAQEGVAMVMGFDIASNFARATLARPGGDVGATTWHVLPAGTRKIINSRVLAGRGWFFSSQEGILKLSVSVSRSYFQCILKRCVWDKTLSFGWDR